MTVKVSKPVRKAEGGWVVSCDVCQPDTFIGILRPWIRAVAWRDALTLALWHRAMHEFDRCPTCQHVPEISEPVILEPKKRWIKLDDAIYAVADTVVHIHGERARPEHTRSTT